MKYRIAISGSYGGMNLGDEAILEGILNELRASVDADIVVFSRDPSDTEKRHHVRAVPIHEMHKNEIMEELKRLDLFIFGGGGILFNGMVERYLRDVNWAKDLGIPVIIYAISVGPFHTPESKKLVVSTFNRVNLITVRENEAKRILNDLGVAREIEVTADPAFLIDTEPFTKTMMEKEGIMPGLPLVGFSIREPGLAAPDLNVEHYHSILANAADFIIERFDTQVIFVPLELGDNKDPQHAHAVISKMANIRRAGVLKGEYTSRQLLGLIQQMIFTVGMRLHFLIFSCLQKVPFVPLPYASKVTGLLKDLEMPMPPINGLSIGKLCAFIDRYWHSKEEIKEKIEAKVPLFQERARRTNLMVVDFLKGITPKAQEADRHASA